MKSQTSNTLIGSSDEIEIRDQSGDPFTAVWNWLLDRPDLSGTEKLAWIALKSYSGCPEIRPSVQTVARRAGVSIRTAQRAITALSKKGLLRVERRSRPDGGFATNRYILLSSPHPHRKTATKSNCHRVTYPPGVMMTPAPGDILAPPQVSLWHQEYIKQIKDNTTTPLQPQKGPDGDGIPKEPTRSELPGSSLRVAVPVVDVDDIKKLVNATAFQKISEPALRMLIQKYGSNRIFDSLDMLIVIYKRNGRPVKDPVAVLSTVLLKGIIPPSDYSPYHERIEKERKAKAAAELRRTAEANKQKAEEEAYSRKVAEFDALPEQEQEVWCNRAKSTLSSVLRNFKYAIRSTAIELYSRGP
jgi:hypothetical protein